MRSATITFVPATATASLLLATGCSSTTTGSGAPTGAGPSATAGAPPSGGASTSASGDQTFGAPRVKTPLDTTKYQQNPCSALTAAQQQQFGVNDVGKSIMAQLGPVCSWRTTNGTIGIQFAVNPAPDTTQTGLANVYESNRPGAFHQLPDVGGQPMVGFVKPNFGAGICVLFVGATDTVDYQLKVIMDQGRDYNDPCGLSQRLAVAATATMKASA